MLAVEFADALVHFLEAHGIGGPHGPAAMGREAVPIDIDDVYIHGPERETLLEDARALVHQRVDKAVDNFFLRDGALLDSRFRSGFAHQLRDFRIRYGAAVFVIFVPARAFLLAVAS